MITTISIYYIHVFVTHAPKQLQEFMGHSMCYEIKILEATLRKGMILQMRTGSPKMKKDDLLLQQIFCNI